MIVNPAMYGKGGAAKLVEASYSPNSSGAKIFYYDANGEVIETIISGRITFTAPAGSSVVTWGGSAANSSATGMKWAATISRDYRCNLWQVNA